MSDILCSWVNYDVQLKVRVNRDSLGNQFRSGYLFGEILHRYGHINTDMFGAMQDAKSNEAAIRNFTLLRSIFDELQIKLTPTKIANIMAKQKDVIREVLYELYIALHKKPLPVTPSKKHSLAFDKDNIAKMRESIQKETIGSLAAKLGHDRQEQRRTQTNRDIFDVHSMKPTGLEIEDNLFIKTTKRLTAQEDMIKQIACFEEKLDNLSFKSPDQNSEEYLEKIRTKRHDQCLAETERQKRRRHVLVREITNIESQQNYHRDNQLISRLIRETRFEKHLAAHLIAVRREKGVMTENRRQLNEQFEEERIKKFDEYLETLNQNEKQEKESLKDQQHQAMILHEHLMKQRQSKKYEKHWKTCKGALDSILDFAFRIAEYRFLAKNKIPKKMIREWRELFHAGLDVFDDSSDDAKQLLNEQDFSEYSLCTGEWKLPSEIVLPKNIIGKRMYQILQQTVLPTPAKPDYSEDHDWPLRIAILGKRFAGKTTIATMIAKNHNIHIIQIQDLVMNAIEASKNTETVTIQTVVPKKKIDKIATNYENVLSEEEQDGIEEAELSILPEAESPEPEIIETQQPSPRASLGGKAADILSRGQQLPDWLIVDIIDEALNHIDSKSGWIIDGYPTNENQAKLMESTRIRLQSVISLQVSDKESIIRSTLTKDTSNVTVQQELAKHHDEWPNIESYFGSRTRTIASDREISEVYNELEQAMFEIMNASNETSNMDLPLSETAINNANEDDSDKKLSDMVLKLKSDESNRSLRRGSKRSLSMVRSRKSIADVENEIICRVTNFVPGLDLDDDIHETCTKILDIDHEMQQAIKNRAVVILSNLRYERETTLRHLANVSDSFYDFLNRPDPRQEYINAWQSEYNSITFELRQDDEVKCELHQRFLDLREQLWEVSDNRKQEAEKERAELMMNGWIRDRIHLIIQHYLNLTHVELMRAALTCLILRLHYLCQGNVVPATAAHSTGLFAIREVPEFTTELLVNIQDSSVSDLVEVWEKCDDVLGEQIKMLEEIESTETDLCKHIVYREPIPPTPPSPLKSAPKGKDKKGKEKTPEPIDPILQGKFDRSDLCKAEALEGARLSIVHARLRIELIKHVLKISIDEQRERFSSTFIKMNDMIKSSFQSEMSSVCEFEGIVQSAIENAHPLPNPIHLNKNLTLDMVRQCNYRSAAKQKDKVVNLHPLLDAAKQLERYATTILDAEKAQEVAEEFDINPEYTKKANAIHMNSTAIFRLRLLKDPIMTYSEWISVTENESPVTELGWLLNKGGKLDSKSLLSLINI